MRKSQFKAAIRKTISLLLFILTLLLIFIPRACPDRDLHVIFCDVGQGDSILIVYKNQQILIDAGPDKKVLSCLGRHLPFWDKTIEAVILTHPDADHVGGMINVFQAYQVNQFVGTGIPSQSAAFNEFKPILTDEGSGINLVSQGNKIKLGDLELKFIWPQQKGSLVAYRPEADDYQVLGNWDSSNETSIVARLDWGEFNVLLTGDITSKEELRLEKSELDSIEILKVAHHGSKYSSDLNFLQTVKPQLAVISSGKNSWGHPTDEVLDRLSQVNSRIMRTDRLGDIEIISNGQSWWIK